MSEEKQQQTGFIVVPTQLMQAVIDILDTKTTPRDSRQLLNALEQHCKPLEAVLSQVETAKKPAAKAKAKRRVTTAPKRAKGKT